jgi:hypothetical protein
MKLIRRMQIEPSTNTFLEMNNPIVPKSAVNTEDHSMNSPNLPNWTYQIKRTAAGIYLLHGVDNRGHRVDSVGTNSDMLEADFFEAAQKIDRSADSPIPIDWE